MLFQPLDLTTALRPSLLPEETLLFVQDAVGLYEGKFKLPNHQNGHAYLTSHRVCYVDNLEPRKHSIAVELKNVERYEFYAGFLKSSAKITLYPKAAKPSLISNRNPSTFSSSQVAGSPSRSPNASPIYGGRSPFPSAGSGRSTPRPSNATWVCTICSFSNPVPSNFDTATATPNMSIPPCLSCGIKPTFPHLLKAAIANAAGRKASQPSSRAPQPSLLEARDQYYVESDSDYTDMSTDNLPAPPRQSKFQCPRCTFLNHPSLLTCELCGAPLLSESKAAEVLGEDIGRPESPGPTLDRFNSGLNSDTECVKFSFRAGGEKIFHERLKGAMVQRKWLLLSAPPVPDSYQSSGSGQGHVVDLDGSVRPQAERARTVGIAGLERQGLELRKKNEAVIGSAFEDLDALMASAKEIIALAESFAKKSGDGSTEANQLIAESAKALDMVTTKDMLGSSSGSESLYLSEMSRNLAEYLTDDAKGVLRKEGGIMSLVDLWAVFNRARGGVELISPMEFEKAARLWEKLKLPIRLRQFKNGLLVVQQADRTDDKTVAQLLAWLQELHDFPPSDDFNWDYEHFGRGITAQEAAQRFGWSVGVASEELEMAEEKGALCREEGVEGLRFWENWIVSDYKDEEDGDDGISVEPVKTIPDTELVQKNLEEMGLV